jgi:hypothetical protein
VAQIDFSSRNHRSELTGSDETAAAVRISRAFRDRLRVSRLR